MGISTSIKSYVELSPSGPRIVIDDAGALRRLESGQFELVTWDNLVEVSAFANPSAWTPEDFFYRLVGADGTACTIPSKQAQDLLQRLERLPGFDPDKLSDVGSSTEKAPAICWKGAAGDGRAAGLATPPVPTVAPSDPDTI